MIILVNSKVVNVVQEVQKAEEDADSIIEEAEERKNEIIKEAKEDAEDIIDEAEREAEKEKYEEMEKFRNKLDEEKEEILEEGKEAGEIALLVFPLALGIQVVQYNFFEDIKVFEFPHEPENAAFVVPIISKRGGHYDILCNKQFIEDVQYNFETHEYHLASRLLD